MTARVAADVFGWVSLSSRGVRRTVSEARLKARSPAPRREDRRHSPACTGCLAPRVDPGAVASQSTLIYTTFSSAYLAFLTNSNFYAIAYGICAQQDNCNYRNVTVEYYAGNAAQKRDFVYKVTFYQMPETQTLLAGQVAALRAGLPSENPAAVGTLAYSLASASGGAISTLTSVVLGSGPYPRPTCDCINGWSGAECETPPSDNTMNVALVVGVTVGGAVVIAAAFALFWVMHKRRPRSTLAPRASTP